MDQFVQKGKDAPSLPRLWWDQPLFKSGKLMGVRRRSSWVLPEKPNSLYRVLIVDDERDIAWFLGELLKTRGFQIATAYEGRTGLAMAAALLPDLVLLNLIMPGLNGYEVLRALRRAPATAHIKVIMHSSLPVGREACARGAEDFIKVPCEFRELHEKVSRVLRA